jgi:dTDP-4-dehydrorhamnose reductase
MKILLLGGSGQLGSELIGHARTLGIEITAPSHTALDVTDPSALLAGIDEAAPEVVINATGDHVVPECDRTPERAFGTNAIAVKNMAEACALRDIEFVTLSTDYVFDGEKGTPYEEDDRPNPLQTYGVSKYAGELLARMAHPRTVVIRTCGLYGGENGSRAKGGNFVLTVLRESEERALLEVSSEQIVNPTYAADLAAATLGLLAVPPSGGIYHLGSTGQCSWAEFAAAIVELADRPMRIVPVDQGARSGTMRRPRFSALANLRGSAAGVTLPHWKDGLGRYLRRLPLVAGKPSRASGRA